MTPRQILIGAALILAVAGVFLGFRSQKAGTANPFDEKTNCGSVFSPIEDAGGTADRITGSSVSEGCASAISDAKPLTYGALGLAGIAFIGAFVAPTSQVARPDATP